MWYDVLAAFAFLFVLEGILPFLSPQRWRQVMRRFIDSSDLTLRITGLISMLAGVVLMFLVHFGWV